MATVMTDLTFDGIGSCPCGLVCVIMHFAIMIVVIEDVFRIVLFITVLCINGVNIISDGYNCDLYTMLWKIVW